MNCVVQVILDVVGNFVFKIIEAFDHRRIIISSSFDSVDVLGVRVHLTPDFYNSWWYSERLLGFIV